MANQNRQPKLKDILNLKSSPTHTTTAIRKPNLDEATVDIGALMRKALQAPKLRTAGGDPSHASDAIPGPSQLQPKDEPAARMDHTKFEFRGNPVYSPDDSLAKAASKLATLRAVSTNPSSTLPTETKTPTQGLPPADASQHIKVAPSQGITPGWRPEAKGLRPGAIDEVPLAAKTIISKRNRRKSVYQRPARYGEWFDGDDEELDRMVGEGNEDDVPSDAQNINAGQQDTRRQEFKDKAARRKSAFPAFNITGSHGHGKSEDNEAERPPAPAVVPPPVAPAGTQASPSELGNDIAQKVRAIADGLCERLDGLIEASPAIAQVARRDEGKSLRDKLLESWEGRSYYERLMQMAGDSGEAEAMKAELDAAKEKSKTCSVAPQATDPAASVTIAANPSPEATMVNTTTVLSFLSPPKPKLRIDVVAGPAKGDHDVRPLTTTAARKGFVDKGNEAAAATGQGHSAESMRSLLKVSASARGPKPFAAPWHSQATTQTTSHVNNGGKHGDLPKADVRPLPLKAEPDVMEVKQETESAKEDELGQLRAALKEAVVARSHAEAALEAAKGEAAAACTVAAEMQQRLNDAEEESKTEEAARKAAEKRIEFLESELEALRAAAGGSAAPLSEAHSKLLDKAADRAAELEGRWGLLEVQLEALQAAANAMATHIATGRSESQSVVDAVAAVTKAITGGTGEDGTEPRRTRTRRKSTWRG